MLKRARGARPFYFDNPDIDRLMTIIMSVAEEAIVTRERLDTIERLLDAKGTISRADIEAYTPDETADGERETARQKAVERILRIVVEEPKILAAEADAKALAGTAAYNAVVREVS
jgi:hypothetical protein